MSTESADNIPISDRRAVDLYRNFRATLHRVERLQLAPEDEFVSPATTGMDLLTFNTAARSMSRELQNAVNHFGRHIHQMSAWKVVYDGASEGEQLELLLDHLIPLATLALSSPQTLKARLCYAVTLTSHAANWVREGGSCQDEWDGKRANFRTARSTSSRWSSWGGLERCLSGLNGSDFKNATEEFRNEHEHGHPPPVELGIIEKVTYSWVAQLGNYGWGIGNRPAVSVLKVAPLLHEQHAAAIDALQSYRRLLIEQGQVLGPRQEQPRPAGASYRPRT